LRDARLGGAFLVGASLRGADLRGTYLRLAKFDGADLSDANLFGAEGLTWAQLDRAQRISGATLPQGLTGRKMAKADHVDLLRRGAAVWNAWQAEHDVMPDLSEASLRAQPQRIRSLSAGPSGRRPAGSDMLRYESVGCPSRAREPVQSGARRRRSCRGVPFGVQFLNCAQLIVARKWQSAFRDDGLGCGAAVPAGRP
jgi:uncharacterized protein YjbI with pentapeptide repeats